MFRCDYSTSALRDGAVTQEFIKSLNKVGPSIGMKFGNPKIVAIADNRPATYVQALNQMIPMKPSIVMVVIPNNKVRLCLSKFLMFNSRFLQGEHYAAIKRVCIMENPIPSQCITSTVLK